MLADLILRDLADLLQGEAADQLLLGMQLVEAAAQPRLDLAQVLGCGIVDGRHWLEWGGRVAQKECWTVACCKLNLHAGC